ncbi:hypothetical protein JQ596_17765 [Bradyrhizobium manausense]|uniref:hypothetical protein n=1 Tax=Bradyrhizobium TaxID=374 RepID=UPI001BA557C6|nr:MULTISPECIES: hypothetical protein [Bradyrhizobium]MBR0827374.1 hypothetical protein [Bradyrhizobium manausense]UVO27332.1 hypothetical protein KUF59_33275 [Bradyrhizobium arachidis]
MLKLRAITTCLALACTPTAAPAASLVGYWYGQGYQPPIHEVTQQIIHYWDDGTFDIHFRIYKNCVLTFDQREAGTWVLRGPSGYRIVTTSVGGVPMSPPATDDYRLEELTEQHTRYVHLATAVEYTADRVDEKFTFPDCASISLSGGNRAGGPAS